MNKSVLKLDEVNKIVKGAHLIQNISFDIKEGEIVGFLGANGAGKTTTMRMIVGLSKITSGEIQICNSSINTNFKEAVKNIGAIIENPDFYNYLSGYENLKLCANQFDNVTEERIQDVIKLVRLDNKIHQKVAHYSLGMKQRLGIGQAILHQPKLLILDEPLNGLDPDGISEFRLLMNYLAKKENTAILISSHLLTEMSLVADRVVILDNGKIIGREEILNDQFDLEKKYREIVGGYHESFN
ncbi:ABC transporter ATP-binding protein [Macrococcus epidermidis]|uniref:ABC transporter ATP-binding protein n=1 Tax=Macrococcus epidermidis TaxID=1902580 RepID=A0A327ZNN0_9STAP|nr:ATP-binding cassette domain-containing protein [Macrococcus epidermidis]RAK43980.1 ABC transporter ATP-binding protein [Macrococcus epidermidis]